MIKKIVSIPYLFLALIMLIVFAIDTVTGGVLTQFGAIGVRNTEMFHGLLFHSFLHGSSQHIMSNLPPFLFFGWLITRSLDNADFYLMWFFISLSSGLCIWLFGAPNSYHIGASGVVFGMWSFLLTLAIKRRSYKDLLIGLIVVMAYGWTFFYGLIPTERVSFAGHFWGLFFGIVYAIAIIKKDKIDKNIPPKK